MTTTSNTNLPSTISYDKDGNARMFTGPDAVQVFRAATIAAACRMYHLHRMLPNRGYTPTKMLTAASSITGKAYKRGQHHQAAADLSAWIEDAKKRIPATAH